MIKNSIIEMIAERKQDAIMTGKGGTESISDEEEAEDGEYEGPLVTVKGGKKYIGKQFSFT